MLWITQGEQNPGDEEVSSMPAGHSVWLCHCGRKGGGAGKDPLIYVVWM